MNIKEPVPMSEVKFGYSDQQNEKTDNQLVLNIAENDPKLDCWTELKVKDKFISKRGYHASVIYKSRLYVYGGQDLNYGIYSDFNSIELNEEMSLSYWEPVTIKGSVSPGLLSRMANVLDDDKWYLFGGTTSAVNNTSNLWCFNFTKKEWSLIKPAGRVPPSLDSCSACLYKDGQGRSFIVVFGGFVGGKTGEYWNQIVIYDIANNKWELPFANDDQIEICDEMGPSPRCGHSAVIQNHNMYVFGGTNGEFRFNDVWIYNLQDKRWNKVNSRENPPPRNGHSAVVFQNEGMIVFGGIQDITHERDDILYFHFGANQWTVLDAEYDHSKVSSTRSPERSNSPDRSVDSQKGERKSKGKSMNEMSPTRRLSPPILLKKDSRSQTKNFDQNSPLKKGLSPGRNSKLQTNNSFALSQTEMRTSATPNFNGARTYQGLSKENEEKRKKLFLVKKANFLKEFEVSDPQDILNLVMKSPTTEAMKNSIVAINYKGQQDVIDSQTASGSQSPFKTKKKAPTPTPMFTEFLGDSFLKIKIPVNGKVAGRKPCARDGHSALVYGNRMVVFGGDRHKMSFNDIYVLNMKQLIQPSRGGKDVY